MVQERKSDMLVVSYSRSGATAKAAREIAEIFSADAAEIEADRYPDNIFGWVNAIVDAGETSRPEIRVPGPKLEPSRYRLIFLGAPVWLYSPAPPIWSYAEQTDFAGQSVILFNTYNSKFSPERIESFRKLVQKRNGILIDHLPFLRGRALVQKSDEEMRQEIRRMLDAKRPEWEKKVGIKIPVGRKVDMKE